MKSLKLVMIAGISIIMYTITATVRQTGSTQSVYTNNIQKEGATDIECNDHLSCSYCIPVNQPY